ncbi:ficolin-2-like [Drosophila rhopaloa]|uniref:Ficolin-2-like n=1 Tax=Drosophila rhopaloa TaxID=1041015 RepID=A0A6P4ES26_DRORH|nr:ficolin-2-like [Drosophila rhopaloa]
MGMDKLHAMTASEPQELLVLLEGYKEDYRYQLYDNFKIGAEANNYTLESVGSSHGDAGNSLYNHVGMKFTTKDRKNHGTLNTNCAELYKGAWCFRSCYTSHLCGKYGENNNAQGIVWETFGKNNYNLKRATMMIRPRRFSSN